MKNEGSELKLPPILREATHDDVPAISRVHVDTWRTTYRGIEVEPKNWTGG
jgi:hypothetical protein